MTKNEKSTLLGTEEKRSKAKIVGLHPEDAYAIRKDEYIGRVVTFKPGAFRESLNCPGYLIRWCKTLAGVGLYFQGVQLEPTPVVGVEK